MQRLSTYSSLLVLGAVLSLSACGSASSSGEETATAAAPPAAGGTGDTTAPAPTSGEKLTLRGQVTDMPIANATVIITVDGIAYQAPLPTTADGSYEVEIESSNPDAMVICEAFDPNGAAAFTAVVDSFAGLQTRAGGGSALGDIDITNVTTAQHLLAQRLTDDGTIDSVAELEETAARVDADDVLELSAAIKLVVENIAGVTLPVDLANTRELAEAILDGSTTFLADVAIVDPGALDAAADLVVSDGNATIPWETESVPGIYTNTEGESTFALFADGTGLAASFAHDRVDSFQWIVNAAGQLEVIYTSGREGSDVVTLMSRSRSVLHVMTGERHAGNDVTRDHTSTIRYRSFAAGFDAATIAGTYSTLGEAGHLKVLLDDHTGYDLDSASGLQSDDFFWEIDGDGVLYLTGTTDGRTTRAHRIDSGAGDSMRLLIVDLDSAGLAADLRVISVMRSDAIVTNPGTDTDASLVLAGSTYASVNGDDVSLFSFEADGHVRQVSQMPRENGLEFEQRDGEWSMPAYDVLRTRFNGQSDAEDTSVLDGLGADIMHVSTTEDAAAGTVTEALRIVPIELEWVRGIYLLAEESGVDRGEQVTMYDDFTGELHLGGELQSMFEWSLGDRGQLIIHLESGSTYNHLTLNMYMTAGSNPGEEMRFVSVRRLNGRLYASPDTGRALSVMRVLREG